MPLCPRCSAEVNGATKCPACGLSIRDEIAATSIKPEGQDHTPTKIKSTEAGKIHTTSSGGARFIAGHVLAGRYRIVGLIGKGGMGEVYKAEDLELDQTVALKFLPEELSKEEELLKRFRSEVRNARRVSHPNVSRVFDIGETQGLYYITMEYIEGDDLSMLLKRIGRLPSDKAVEISRQICLGLGAIHKAGILHRDLKPANIIIDQNGEARITDFGIAGIESEVQGAEARVGTPAYMSPEQITGKEVTKRSDIYSLGLLLYEIFTGKQAFEGGSVDELSRKHQTTNPTTPSVIVTGIDPVVEALIERCLSKDPKERPDSALRVAMSLPGGDPLKVALEAGETPTPEMVAAAPKKGVLKPAVALTLLAVFVASFLLAMYFVSVYTDAGWSPIFKSSEVLTEKGKSILEDLGYTAPSANSVSHFDIDQKYDFYVTATNSSNTLEKYRTGQPFAVYFWYRQSTDPLAPMSKHFITEIDPPLTKRGSEYVKLDPLGRLVKLVAAPSVSSSQDEVGREMNWAPVFEKAGLDIANFSKTRSEWTPPVYADERAAWKGTLADHPDVPIRIEAASYQGRPVFFNIVPPWDEAEQTIQSIEAGFGVQEYIAIALGLTAFLSGLFLGFRNVRAGRGDLKGAAKIAAYMFICLLLSGILGADHVAALTNELGILSSILRDALLYSAILLVLYLAVEPLVRRWWPDLLISWNRLLAGDFRDPIIGRDILIGGLLGLLSVNAFYFAGFVRDYVYAKQFTRQATNAIDVLSGTRHFLEYMIGAMSYPVFGAFGILTLFLVFYLIFRRKWLGTVVLGLIWAGFMTLPYFLNRGVVAASIEFLVWFGIVFLFARYGLVAIIASNFFIFLTGLPITFDPARPYFIQSLIVILIGIALAVYAFYVSIGNQKFLEGDVLKDLPS